MNVLPLPGALRFPHASGAIRAVFCSVRWNLAMGNYPAHNARKVAALDREPGRKRSPAKDRPSVIAAGPDEFASKRWVLRGSTELLVRPAADHEILVGHR